MANQLPAGANQSDRATSQVSGDFEARDDRAVLQGDDFDRDVWCLLGLPVDAVDIDRAVGEIDRAIRDSKKLSFVTPNVNWLVSAVNNPIARREIVNADLSVADGAPLVFLAKLLGIPIRSRVAGADIFEAMRRRPGFAGRATKVFFFGGRDGAAEAASAALNKEAGGVESVGWINPGYGGVETMSAPHLIEQINAAEPDFVLVALGAKKGQAWIERNKGALTAPVTAHLGAVVDFAAGGIARAPELVRKIGLEWLWRIKEEPALWRRYLNDGVGLASVIIRRLAPQFRMRRAQRDLTPPAIKAVQGRAMIDLILSGDFVRPNLGLVRQAFRNASARNADICLDFSNIGDFDHAFLGLVIMLEKHVANNDRTLYVNGAAKHQSAILRANGLYYPSAARAKASAAEKVTAAG